MILHFLICLLSRKFTIARYLLTGKPVVVMSPRGINYKELKSLNMTLDDLMELIRGCSVFNLSEIAYAIIETNGNLSIIKKAECEPPTREDIKVKVSQNTLPMNIILDGEVMKDNADMAGVNHMIINECLAKANLKKVRDVLILTIDNNGEVFIQGKNQEECHSFQIDYSGGDKW